MELLEQYLNVIKMYLPRDQREDIIHELYENLLSEMEDKETEMGRPLNEDEQADILRRHGAPQLVAKRYAPDQPCVAFGRQLIGPESFPIYIRILWIVLGCMVIVHASLAILGRFPGIVIFINSMFWTFVSMTLITILIDLVRKKTKHYWHTPSMYYLPVPKWIPVTGFFVVTACTLWWAGVPLFPRLIFGMAAGEMELTATWHFFYWPVLLLLLINSVHRGVFLLRPQWMWLSMPIRLGIYFICLVMLYFLLDGYPYVSVSNLETAGPGITGLAHNMNQIIYAALLIGGPVYWFINIIVCGWFFIKGIQYWRWLRQNKQQSNK
ncbi:MAG: hypothetical protein JW896_03365 [Deltaproteobacteria bacterium]|nr:hypothetical protein [Deltaproteobacteria bacterium]